jgi:hypothetical protein
MHAEDTLPHVVRGRVFHAIGAVLEEQGLSDTADVHQAERNVVINHGSRATP